jgi:hypothetical protein
MSAISYLLIDRQGDDVTEFLVLGVYSTALRAGQAQIQAAGDGYTGTDIWPLATNVNQWNKGDSDGGDTGGDTGGEQEGVNG